MRSTSSTRTSPTTGSRVVTTCSRWTWRWIRFPATRSRAGSRGYGDFAIRPDLDSLRRIPWLEGTALVLCDVGWDDGSPVRPSPRQVLKAQVERARELGYEPMIGSELEFYLLKESFEEAHAKHYRELTPSVPYILDYHVLATTLRRAVHAPDPERHARRGHHGRELEGRGLAGAAGGQLQVCGRRDRWRTTIRSTRTAPRRSRI